MNYLYWHPLPELVPPRPKLWHFGLQGPEAPKTPKIVKIAENRQKRVFLGTFSAQIHPYLAVLVIFYDFW
jgi:hypothetical protein